MTYAGLAISVTPSKCLGGKCAEVEGALVVSALPPSPGLLWRSRPREPVSSCDREPHSRIRRRGGPVAPRVPGEPVAYLPPQSAPAGQRLGAALASVERSNRPPCRAEGR